MRKLLYILALLPLFLLFLLSACTDDKEVVALLDRAEALMEAAPDSASRLLHAADSAIARQSEPTRMRHAVLLAQANNKLYQPLPSDTTFQEVVDYYDRHGSPNQQLLAHYLLGCIHRDRNEAPQALQCYYDAIEKADTLSEDCDYMTLYKVYGQMGELYDQQLMPEEAIEAKKKYSHYALRANDIFNYIKGIELMAISYFAQCDTPNVFKSTFESARLYRKHGYPQEAANVYHEAIDIYLGTAQYEKAHELMQICETQSGLFNQEGEPVKKSYYYNKGRYYAGIHCLDSAELCFRKLLAANYEYDAYKGLLSCFLERRNTDSIVKYAALCEDGLMQFLAKNQIQEIVQTSSLYDYSRHQKTALIKTHEAELEKRKKWTIFIVGIVIIATIVWWFVRERKAGIARNRKLSADYTQATTRLLQAEHELTMLEESYSDMKEHVLEVKQMEIEGLKESIKNYQERFDTMQSQEKEMTLYNSDIVKSFKAMSHPKMHSSLPQENNWENLLTLTQQCLPMFHQTITQDHALTEQELRAAILVRLNFLPGEIAILLNTSPARISTVKRHINQKLYGEEDATSLYRNMKKGKNTQV